MPVTPPGGTNGGDAVETVFDSIALVKADQAWALGYRGQGVVVAGADTGVRWTHEALKSKYRGWNGATANHNYNWHDAIHNPDPANVCGGLRRRHPATTTSSSAAVTARTPSARWSATTAPGQKNEIGMAPDAKWIACRNMNNGVGAVPTYLECMQWFLAPTDDTGTNPDPTKAPARRSTTRGAASRVARRPLAARRARGEPRRRDLLRRLGR